MNVVQAIILSIVEGISEFLPISSTGHLILASTLLHITQTEFVKSFEIFIQMGAILAVVVLYARNVFVNKKIFARVILAFLPTAIIGFILYKFIKHYLLGNPWVVVFSLGIGGITLIAIELFYKTKQTSSDIEHISGKQAAIIGVIQALSVIPGVSRAAATIIGGQLIGLSRRRAVEFSFLLAIPTMTAATALDLIKTNALSFSSTDVYLLAVGCTGSFITALFVLKVFLRYIQHHSFIPFGIYRIAIAIIYGFYLLR